MNKLTVKVFSTLMLMGASSSLCLAAPTTAAVAEFPDLSNEMSCAPLFESTERNATQGRISCFRTDDIFACVIGEDIEDGAGAAQKLAEGKTVSSALAKNTTGAMVVYPDRGVIAGITKGVSKAQKKISKGELYKQADAVIVPAPDHQAGRFAKATVGVPVTVGKKKYIFQDSNIIVGKDADNITSFFAVVTGLGSDAVVHYVRGSDRVSIKCSNVRAELLGDYLVAPGLIFNNK
jgi:hypothetical protein